MSNPTPTPDKIRIKLIKQTPDKSTINDTNMNIETISTQPPTLMSDAIIDQDEYNLDESVQHEDMVDDTPHPLLSYIINGEINDVEACLSTMTVIECNNIRDENDCTVLMLAAQYNQLPILQRLVQFLQQEEQQEQEEEQQQQEQSSSQIDLSPIDIDGCTLFHHAVYSDNIEMIDYVANLYSTIQPQQHHPDEILTTYGDTVLHYGVWKHKLNSIRHLITNYKCNILLTNHEQQTIVHFAAMSGDILTLDYILTLPGAKSLLNALDCNNATPLIKSFESFEMFKYLIEEYDVNINIVDKDGITMLHCAVHNNDIDFLNYAFSLPHRLGPIPYIFTEENDSLLYHAIRNNKLVSVQYLSQNYDFDFTSFNKTIVHVAATTGNIEMFDYIMTLPTTDSFLRIEDSDLCTPLLIAVRDSKNVDFVAHLIETYYNHEGDTLSYDVNGNSLFHHAVLNGDIEMVDLIASHLTDDGHLLRNNTIPNNEHQTVVHLAITKNDLDMVKILIEDYKATTHQCDSQMRNIAHYAAQYGSVELLQYVLKISIDFHDSLSKNGNSLLHCAVQGGNIKTLLCLVNTYNLDVFCMNHRKQNIMFIAVENNQVEMIPIISKLYKNKVPTRLSPPDIPQCPQVRSIGEWNNAPLLSSCNSNESLECIRTLIRLKADINYGAQYYERKYTSFFHQIIHQPHARQVLDYLLSNEFAQDYDLLPTFDIFTQLRSRLPLIKDIIQSSPLCDVFILQLLYEKQPNQTVNKSFLYMALQHDVRRIQAHATQNSYDPSNTCTLIDFCIERGIDINEVGHDGLSPIDFATRYCYYEVISHLMQYKPIIYNNTLATNTTEPKPTILHHILQRRQSKQRIELTDTFLDQIIDAMF